MSEQLTVLDHIQTLRWLITIKINHSNTNRSLLRSIQQAHVMSDRELIYCLVDLLTVMKYKTKEQLREIRHIQVNTFTGYETKCFVEACNQLTSVINKFNDIDRHQIPTWFRCANLSSTCEESLKLLYYALTKPNQKTTNTENRLYNSIVSVVRWSVVAVVVTQAATSFLMSQYIFQNVPFF